MSHIVIDVTAAPDDVGRVGLLAPPKVAYVRCRAVVMNAPVADLAGMQVVSIMGLQFEREATPLSLNTPMEPCTMQPFSRWDEALDWASKSPEVTPAAIVSHVTRNGPGTGVGECI